MGKASRHKKERSGDNIQLRILGAMYRAWCRQQSGGEPVETALMSVEELGAAVTKLVEAGCIQIHYRENGTSHEVSFEALGPPVDFP